MARYIDADVLIERIKYFYDHTGDQSTNAEHYAYGVCLSEIEHADTAPSAKWHLYPDGSAMCMRCRRIQIHIWDFDNIQRYCGCCGSDMFTDEPIVVYEYPKGERRKQ